MSFYDPTGLEFRLTTRRLMILILYCAALFATLPPQFRQKWPSSTDLLFHSGVFVIFWLATPFILLGLILLLDRPSPARRLAAFVLCLLMYLPTLGLFVWLLAIERQVAGLRPDRSWNLLATWMTGTSIIAPLLAVSVAFPARCPSCGRRALVRTLHNEKERPTERWCAFCGRLYYWRSGRWERLPDDSTTGATDRTRPVSYDKP